MNRQGGGVCCYIRSDIRCKRLDCYVHPLTESIWMQLSDSKIILNAIYVPPNLKAIHHREIIENIIDSADLSLAHLPEGRLIVAGDINNLSTSDIETSLDMIQIVDVPTRNDSILDKILISKKMKPCYFNNNVRVSTTDHVPALQVGAPIGNSDHRTVILRSHVKQRTISMKVKSLYDFRFSNIRNFLNELQLVDWSPIYDETVKFESKCCYFKEQLNDVFNKAVPVSYVTLSTCEKPWMTPLLKELINKRWMAYREKNFTKFRHYKKKCSEEIVKAKRMWAEKQSRKNIWSVVKRTRGTKASDNFAMILKSFSSTEEASNAINDGFFSHTQKSCPVYLPENSIVKCTPFSAHEVFTELERLNPKKSSADIPTRLYKIAAFMIAEPLCFLFNWSLSQGIVPKVWKCAKVTPIPKSSSVNPNDLRPISILPIPAKVMEKLMLKRIKTLALSCFSLNQFGFRPLSSTTCALISLHDFCTRCLERPDVVGVQITTYDFSKAFDRIRHDTILHRLLECNFSVQIVRWISSYLDNRTQFVQIDGFRSDTKHVASGVPQGSILGPFLFSMTTGSFALNREECKDCKLIMYADDFTICSPIFIRSTNPHISKAHESLLQWSTEKCFLLNVKKCKTLVIPRKVDCTPVALDQVEVVQELKLLGVTLNNKGNWSNHVRKIVTQASRNLYVIRILKHSLPKNHLITIYKGVVRAILEYSSPLFVSLSKKDSLKMERVQRRFHRILCGGQCEEHHFTPLADRRKLAAIKLFKKAISTNHILNSLLPIVSSSGRYMLPYIKYTRRQNSFVPFVAFLLNEFHVR